MLTIPLRVSLLLAACCCIAATPAAQGDAGKIPDDKDPVTTASGLRYSVLTPGQPGKSPKLGDKVKVHYTGWLTDGTVFDSSRQRGEPAEFVLGAVIEGWNEALQLMTPGARYKLTLPSALAYGDAGRPPTIPQKATLVFDVELISFVEGPPLPVFRKPDQEKQTKTASGLEYEVLAAGEGESPAPDQLLELSYALWNTDGRLMESSVMMGETLQGTIEDFRLPFLKESLALMKPGARWLCEVPPELAFGPQPRGALPANSTTIWEVQLVKVYKPQPVPEFVLPKDEELTATASGLKYQKVKEGHGDAPKMGGPIKVHYAGWLIDGTLFDSSFTRGIPMTGRVGQFVSGWNEGLQLMQPGAVYRFVIPPQLGYGAQGAPPKIGPNATLVFYVELLAE